MEPILERVIEIAQHKELDKMVLIYDGSQEQNGNPRSHVYRVGDFCVKYYVRTLRDCDDEAKNLAILEQYGFAPKLYYKDPERHYIIMEYIDGTALGEIDGSLTTKQREELDAIKAILDEHRIYYEKEYRHCIIEPSGKVRFLDFNL